MKIHDISQEVFGCDVYPGDPKPIKTKISSIPDGDLYNLSSFSMCAHNGTHVDAPAHFLKDGGTVSDIPLERLVGYAYVTKFDGEISENDAKAILEAAHKESKEAAKRILIAGDATVSNEAAEFFAQSGIFLIGNESQSIGPTDAPMAAHLALLSQGIVLLEGIRLRDIPDGVYLLSAAPINLGDLEGAPCRAILIELD